MNAAGSAAPIRLAMLIGDRAVESESTFLVRNPGYTEDIVAEVAEGEPEHVDAAVAAAEQAASWVDVTLEERVALLEKAAETIEDSTDDFAPLLSRENGGTLLESSTDLTRGLQVFRNLIELAAKRLQPEVTEQDQYSLSFEKIPLGVCGLIVPWNSPIVLAMSKLGPALAAGNTVVVKPSIFAPVVLGNVLANMATVLPPGVINVVQGDAEAGSALAAHPRVRKISFTGSIATGRKVMVAAAGNVKSVSLELGGNDAAIVLDDADFDAIMPAMCRAIFMRAGQICLAIKRVYVPRSRFDEFEEKMSEIVATYRVGYGLDERTTFGPVINATEFQRIEGLVERARGQGAKVRELGQKVDPASWDKGYYMLPRIVTGIAPEAELVQVEQFGPVIPLIPYDDVEDSIAMANDTEYGLCSSVWSTDDGRAHRVARRLQAGVTFINCHGLQYLSFDMPLGGVKQSGLGRERTVLGIDEYVEEHVIRVAK